MKKNILLLISTIILLLVLSEIGARIWVHFRPFQKFNDKGLYSYFPYLPYSPTPFYNDSTRILNSRGFRNAEEFQIPKPNNFFRIICMGGSSTFDDYGKQPNDKIWTGRLSYYLNQNSKNLKFEVINASAHNYNTYMNFIDYLTRCRDLQVDMIIIYEGINELYFNGFDSVSFAFYNVFRPFDFTYQDRLYKVNHNFWLKNSDFLKLLYIKFFINPDMYLNLMATKTVNYWSNENIKNIVKDSLLTLKKGLEGFAAIAKSDNCKLVFLSQAYDFKNLMNYFNLNDSANSSERKDILIKEGKRVKNMMEEIANKDNIPFLDMDPILNQDDKYFSGPQDMVHFSKEGSDFFAKNLSDFLISNKLTP